MTLSFRRERERRKFRTSSCTRQNRFADPTLLNPPIGCVRGLRLLEYPYSSGGILRLYIGYWTAWVEENGTVHFRPDLYGWDRRLSSTIRFTSHDNSDPASGSELLVSILRSRAEYHQLRLI